MVEEGGKSPLGKSILLFVSVQKYYPQISNHQEHTVFFKEE